MNFWKDEQRNRQEIGFILQTCWETRTANVYTMVDKIMELFGRYHQKEPYWCQHVWWDDEEHEWQFKSSPVNCWGPPVKDEWKFCPRCGYSRPPNPPKEETDEQDQE